MKRWIFSWWAHRNLNSAFVLLSAVLFSISNIFSQLTLSPYLAALSAFFLIFGMERARYRGEELFIWGMVFHLSSFYWLPDTLSFFGGFPGFISFALFVLYAAISSVQFLLVAFLDGRLRKVLPEYSGLAFPLAWFVLEFLFPRLFPWCFAHPFIGVTRFSSLASFVGVSPLSFVVLWLAALFYSFLRAQGRERRKLVTAFCLLLGVMTGLSQLREKQLEEYVAQAPSLRVALIQGNLAAKQKGDVKYLSANLERYRELSRGAVKNGAELLIWPESVMNVWTPESTAFVNGTKLDPFPGSEVTLLYGGLSFRPRSESEIAKLPKDLEPREAEELKYHKFNTAFVRSQAGEVLGFYHKRVLMPFGEYLPLAETFPVIRKVSPHSGDFSSGDKVEPIDVPASSPASVSFHLGLLICYEDLLAGLSREIANRGANVLVNLTNDAWYGETAAPYQHHLLAAWRAIETGRYLLRSTNTGVTGIVDPWGRTIAELPIFAEGVLNEEIRLLDQATTYTAHGEVLAWALVGLSLLCLLRLRIKPR